MRLISFLSEEIEQLDEHLGNLESVDKELVKSLFVKAGNQNALQNIGFQTSKYKTNSKDEDWNSGDARVVNTLGKTIGRDSEIKHVEESFTDAADLFKLSDTAALIVELNGKQSLLIAFKNAINGENRVKSYGNDISFEWRVTKRFIRDNQGVKFPSGKSFTDELVKLLKISSFVQAGTISDTAKVEALLKLIAQLAWTLENQESPKPALKMVKDALLPKLSIDVIHYDKKRVDNSQARIAARKGFVPVPKTPTSEKFPGAKYSVTSHEVHIKSLVSGLKYRLNRLKNSRSPSFDESEEMLKHFIDEGYAKKLTFMGAAYNLKDTRIDMDDLMLGNKGRGESYIEYKCENSISYTDPRHESVRAELKEIRKKLLVDVPPPPAWVTDRNGGDEEKNQKAIDKYNSSWAYDKSKVLMGPIYLKHNFYPSRIKVGFVLEGGKILPAKINMEFSDY